MSRRVLQLEKILETLEGNFQSCLERLFTEGNEVKYILLRHTEKGFLFAIYISSKYEVRFSERFMDCNVGITFIEDEDDTKKHSEYELLFGSYMDNSYSSLSLDTPVTQLNFNRFMKSVSFNPNFGLFIVSQYNLSHIRSSGIYKYTPATRYSKHICTVPVISVEEIASWSPAKMQVVENMVEKLWTLLTEISVRHASTMATLKESLNALEKNKAKYDAKRTVLRTDYRKCVSEIEEIGLAMSQVKLERDTEDPLKLQALNQKMANLETKRKRLFLRRTELENELNTHHILLDEIVYRSHICLTQLNDLTQNISKFL